MTPNEVSSAITSKLMATFEGLSAQIERDVVKLDEVRTHVYQGDGEYPQLVYASDINVLLVDESRMLVDKMTLYLSAEYCENTDDLRLAISNANSGYGPEAFLRKLSAKLHGSEDDLKSDVADLMDNVAKTVSRLRENLVANAYGVEVGVKDASRQKKRETFSAQVCAGRSMSREEFGHLEDLVSAASLEHENSYLAG